MSESDVKNLKIEIATSLSISSCFFKFINHHYHDQTLASSSGLTWLDQTNKNRWPVKPSQWVPRSEDSHETIVRLSKMSNGHPKKKIHASSAKSRHRPNCFSHSYNSVRVTNSNYSIQLIRRYL